MILTDREIAIALDQGAILLDPPPQAAHFSSTALDLTLAREFRAYKAADSSLSVTIEPTEPDYSIIRVFEHLTDACTIGPDGFVLKPGQLVLAWTQQILHLPVASRLAARVEGKSSLARLGLLVHFTAPTIHAGFKGKIQLEVINLGPRPIRLKEGMAVCQLIFEQTLGVAQSGYAGRFAGQSAANF